MTTAPASRAGVSLGRRAQLALLALILVCVLTVVGLFAYLEWIGPLPGEARLARELRLDLPTLAVPFVNFLSYFGDPVIATVLAMLTVAGAWERCGRETAALVAAAAAVVAVSTLLKLVFGETQRVAPSPVANYPSGTTAFVTALLGVTALLAWRSGHRAAAIGAGLLVATVGPAVVMVGEHYPSDSVAGYCTGIGWVAALLLVADRLGRRDSASAHARVERSARTPS